MVDWEEQTVRVSPRYVSHLAKMTPRTRLPNWRIDGESSMCPSSRAARGAVNCSASQRPNFGSSILSATNVPPLQLSAVQHVTELNPAYVRLTNCPLSLIQVLKNRRPIRLA